MKANAVGSHPARSSAAVEPVAEDTPDLVGVPEAAAEIHVHPDTLYGLCRAGQFPPAIRVGGRWRVSRPRLQRYLHGA